MEHRKCYCVGLAEKPQPYSLILPLDAYEMIRQNRGNPDFVLIDIRTPEEFMSGYIEGAININYHDSDFVEKLEKLDKNKTYLGDIARWKAEGLPVVKK